MASGYLIMYRQTGELKYLQKAKMSLEWLMKSRSALYSQHSWGNQFDFVSRGGKWPKDEPSIVWSSHIGQVFLDAYELLKEKRYLEARKAQWSNRLLSDQGVGGLIIANGTCKIVWQVSHSK